MAEIIEQFTAAPLSWKILHSVRYVVETAATTEASWFGCVVRGEQGDALIPELLDDTHYTLLCKEAQMRASQNVRENGGRNESKENDKDKYAFLITCIQEHTYIWTRPYILWIYGSGKLLRKPRALSTEHSAPQGFWLRTTIKQHACSSSSVWIRSYPLMQIILLLYKSLIEPCSDIQMTHITVG